ncbi:MAG: homospermidine synthase [Omnitrophica bacterium RIFCSPHIGHO2_02_FULL_46_11]|nr:MAG: homospermidine synthase [Omnitrophica bacterium RIFCSPLOWO2_01_FULL_45_10b]OGW86002.1 MAG: homospermidine synthase [Omnitrophica bacterium RIFCSPHIGHO2_02_FULL_46_11]
MASLVKFSGKILVIGCGSVSQCAIPLILKLIDVPPKNVTIMDPVDNRHRVKEALAKGVSYVHERVVEENYKTLLSKYVGPGDYILDLAYDIDCCAILEWCRDHDVRYLNTSVELWHPYVGAEGKHPTELTLYARHMAMRKMIATWPNNKGATAIIDHGANPGLVSHFTKQALEDIAKKILKEKSNDPRKKALEEALKDQNFSKLAQLEGVKTIHISERDTQITNRPKEVDEFVNTWSILGFYEEGVAPAELGWGTHERYVPKGAMFHKEGPKNQICLTSKGMSTWVRSWVPCGEITGMVIRHGEAFSISDYLTIWDNGKAIYRPTVHYAYCPADVAINSMHELEMRQFDLQERQRILNDDIISGRDELGCLLMGHDFKSWWIGSLLDIEETRRLVPHQNATTLQVAISAVAASIWSIQNPHEGIRVPDELPHEEILSIAKPYLGPFISKAVDWTPLQDRKNRFLDYGSKTPRQENVWQFVTFLVSPHQVEAVKSDSYEEIRI